MNNVHRAVALATAHKLRSAAAALLADSEAQADPRLADSLMYEAGELRARADSIEQVKPPVEEPSAFGSIVRATCCNGTDDETHLWQKSPMQGKHYWESETGAVEVWPELTNVEVLRIGVGEAAHAHEALLAEDAALLWHRLDDLLSQEGEDMSGPSASGALRGARSFLAGALGRHGFTSLLSDASASADADEFMTAAGFDARMEAATPVDVTVNLGRTYTREPLAEWETELLNQQYRRDTAAAVLTAMDVDQYLIDAVANARPL